jgi:hypothetical protein
MRLAALLPLASIVLAAACGGSSKPAAGTPGAPRGKIGVTSIRSVDFLNRTYDTGDGAITVKDGEAEIEVDPELPELHGFFNVSPPVYGDVDGDGAEDAIVMTAYNGGGTGTFTSAEIYALREGQGVVKLGEIPGGDRGDGGLDDLRIEDGRILVDRNQSAEDDGACCPSLLVHELWRWNGSTFVEDEAARQTVSNPSFQGD